MMAIGTSPEIRAGVSRLAVIVTSSASMPYLANRPSSLATHRGAAPIAGVFRPYFSATRAGGAVAPAAAATGALAWLWDAGAGAAGVPQASPATTNRAAHPEAARRA